MDDKTKREQIQKYFRKLPVKFAVILGILALILLGSSAWLAGIIVLAVLAGMLFYYLGAKPTDEQIDKWLEEDIKKLHARALSKLGIDQSDTVAEPVEIIGLRFWDIGDSVVRVKVGKDGALRFSPIEITILNFCKDQLLRYTCAWDFAIGTSISEETDEYFYKDIVSVSTKSENMTVNLKEGKETKSTYVSGAETFVLTTSGGTSIQVVLNAEDIIKEYIKKTGRTPGQTKAEAAIQSIRKMLREKKGQ